MATSSINTNVELDEKGLRRFLKAMDKSKEKQVERHKWKDGICDYCNKEVEKGNQYICKIGDNLYSGHKYCMMCMSIEEGMDDD